MKVINRLSEILNTRSITRPKKKPKWYQLRYKLSAVLINLARLVYPENPEVMAYFYDIIFRQVIEGGCLKYVTPEEVYKEQENNYEQEE